MYIHKHDTNIFISQEKQELFLIFPAVNEKDK